jgi:hypothetical protein
MQLNRALVGWYFRAARSVTLPAAVAAALYVITYTGRLSETLFVPFALIVVQSVTTAWLMSRFNSPAAAFLYTRGFTRDRLWAHRIVAHLLCVITVWGPASLLVWLGVRSVIQEQLFENPYYPLMTTTDFAAPGWWLAAYLLLVGIVEYGPIRRAQPTLDYDAGYMIEFGLLIMLLMFLTTRWLGTWYFVLVAAAFTSTSVALLVGSWRLHREIKVRP